MKITLTFSEPPTVRCFNELLGGFTRAYRGITIEDMHDLTFVLETVGQVLNRYAARPDIPAEDDDPQP